MGNRRLATIVPPSDLAVRAVRDAGGLVSRSDLERRLGAWVDRRTVGGAIGLAVISGQLERASMLDGAEGFAIAEARRAA
jgi:hypothetical protein